MPRADLAALPRHERGLGEGHRRSRPIRSTSRPGAIPWLKLEVVGRSRGVDGGRRLTDTAYIQRVNTVGGVAPATGCSEAAHVGARALVPYETDYYFYKSRGRQK